MHLSIWYGSICFCPTLQPLWLQYTEHFCFRLLQILILLQPSTPLLILSTLALHKNWCLPSHYYISNMAYVTQTATVRTHQGHLYTKDNDISEKWDPTTITSLLNCELWLKAFQHYEVGTWPDSAHPSRAVLYIWLRIVRYCTVIATFVPTCVDCKRYMRYRIVICRHCADCRYYC